MPLQVFSVSEVKRLLDQGAQLVDVLGEDEFARDHLPGAINIPLKRLDERTVAASIASGPSSSIATISVESLAAGRVAARDAELQECRRLRPRKAGLV